MDLLQNHLQGSHQSVPRYFVFQSLLLDAHFTLSPPQLLLFILPLLSSITPPILI